MSKPIGTALALAGGTDDDKAAAIAGMRELNRAAAEELSTLGAAVHAVTDVTGFGVRFALELLLHQDPLRVLKSA